MEDAKCVGSAGSAMHSNPRPTFRWERAARAPLGPIACNQWFKHRQVSKGKPSVEMSMTLGIGNNNNVADENIQMKQEPK